MRRERGENAGGDRDRESPAIEKEKRRERYTDEREEGWVLFGLFG